MSSETLLLASTPAGIGHAARLLRDGRLVAFATETVYGLGADATNGEAVAAIYAAKGRPSFNPLIVHVPDAAAARRHVQWSDAAEALAGAFWPGPMTLVLPLAHGHGISSLVTAGLQTLAVRVPAAPVARALLSEAGVPVAAPSANPSGRISPTTAAHVLAGLNGRIAAVLDDGPCPVGVESTILDPGPPARMLREGGVTAEDVARVLGSAPLPPETSTITAPGQLASHYAPRAHLRLNAAAPQPGETYLGFGPGPADLSLSESGDLAEAAATLFARLHDLDAMGVTRAAVAPVPDQGLGRAINDRLRRAAAPR
ncbi:L-threonylcarbamoyladenylate synthase [Pseudaestuariivita atlantica]|uniref:Threonylcarbamoyl-AMP synthase n=1 Tax=Pseudaestuariivita atlantica TaxID=1317121 RepID=A0A0L1JME8_9RHOB|nr:L-threonylcarbamoyladenylate synthase [Pseudaestuariivita atlantica]KNG92583.1 translation factor Sua5 [Pseudaestuariivita atlantica]